ncbi:hypothetical protein SELMODRAFT_408498 [Selaginella moellendorffii]|uniref:26S proteasome non-ATPase regulatory subunit 3 N-terminal TPR repeats domain-containing protein n=1 Tax=Selaginella moellendorffii TaxID=88036 RepID=D8R8H8_SELML|nr:hypothetical protein SELMODRAFT_408498 [Selaginella moellendorffii]
MQDVEMKEAPAVSSPHRSKDSTGPSILSLKLPTLGGEGVATKEMGLMVRAVCNVMAFVIPSDSDSLLQFVKKAKACSDAGALLDGLRNVLYVFSDLLVLHQQLYGMMNWSRNYLHYNLYDQAEKLHSKSQRSDSHSNQQLCRYLFYLRKIRTIQFKYTDAKDSLMPQERHRQFPRKALRPCFELTNAVRIGDLELFRSVADKFSATFYADKTHNLMSANVIQTAFPFILFLASSCLLPHFTLLSALQLFVVCVRRKSESYDNLVVSVEAEGNLVEGQLRLLH